MDREFTLKTLLVMFLRKTRAVIVWALIVGVLVGGFMALSAYRDESAGEAQGAPEKYSEELAAAQEAVERIQRQIGEVEEYLENSLYQALNPFNKGEGTVLFFVDTERDQEAEPGVQGADPRKTVIAAYLSFYNSDEALIQDICELMGTDLDERYVLELIDVSLVDGAEPNEFVRMTDSNIVQITVSYEDAAVAKQIAQLVFEESQKHIRESVQEHTATVLAEKSGYVVDTALRETQLEYDTKRTELKASLAEKEAALETLESSQPSGSDGISLFSIAKKAVIGFVIGVIIAAVAVFVLALLSGKLQSVDELVGLNIPLVGIVPKGGRKGFVARWIDKLEGDPAVEPAQALALVAANLERLAPEQTVCLVGTADAAALAEVADGLKGKAVLCGNVLQEAEAVQALDKADGVVLVEERGVSSAARIAEEIDRLKALNKAIVGILLR